MTELLWQAPEWIEQPLHSAPRLCCGTLDASYVVEAPARATAGNLTWLPSLLARRSLTSLQRQALLGTTTSSHAGS